MLFCTRAFYCVLQLLRITAKVLKYYLKPLNVSDSVLLVESLVPRLSSQTLSVLSSWDRIDVSRVISFRFEHSLLYCLPISFSIEYLRLNRCSVKFGVLLNLIPVHWRKELMETFTRLEYLFSQCNRKRAAPPIQIPFSASKNLLLNSSVLYESANIS